MRSPLLTLASSEARGSGGPSLKRSEPRSGGGPGSVLSCRDRDVPLMSSPLRLTEMHSESFPGGSRVTRLRPCQCCAILPQACRLWTHSRPQPLPVLRELSSLARLGMCTVNAKRQRGVAVDHLLRAPFAFLYQPVPTGRRVQQRRSRSARQRSLALLRTSSTGSRTSRMPPAGRPAPMPGRILRRQDACRRGMRPIGRGRPQRR
jgi:hypothetical protein